MRTISVMPMARQRAIARRPSTSTHPLAHRLGVQQVKWQAGGPELRDPAPEALRRDRADGRGARPEREAYLGEVMDLLSGQARELRHQGRRQGATESTSGASTRRWSWAARSFDEIFDLVGLRVVVEEDRDCWAGAGRHPRALVAGVGPLSRTTSIRQVQPVPVAAHHRDRTARQGCRGPGAHPRRLHRRAEFGIAAHWGYKEGASNKDIAWMQRLATWARRSTTRSPSSRP